jgi:GTPase SAR1 family protein
VGKTSLILSYAMDEFPTLYTPTMFDQYKVGEIYRKRAPDKLSFSMTLMDASGLPEHKSIR